MTSHSVTLSKVGTRRFATLEEKQIDEWTRCWSKLRNDLRRHPLDCDSVRTEWIVMFHHPLDSSRKSNLNFVGRFQRSLIGKAEVVYNRWRCRSPKTEVCSFPANTLITQFARRNGRRQGTALTHDLFPAANQQKNGSRHWICPPTRRLLPEWHGRRPDKRLDHKKKKKVVH